MRRLAAMTEFVLPALLTFLIAVVVTPPVARFATSLGIVDRPGGRRIHKKITPRLGGLAVVIAFFAVFAFFVPDLEPHFKSNQLLVFALASALLVGVGFLDDRRGVPAGWQLASHVTVALALVAVGMGIEEVTNPFGGKLALDQWQLPVPGLSGHDVQLPADLLTVAWVVLVINAVNWLDGLDGLASGVGLISAATIALLSVSAVVNQPHVATLALLLVGSLAGFLLYNFHPARIFLGTIGSTFVGFTIATLAIISGGKIATALLVLGFPILDTLAVLVRRAALGVPLWKPDAKHLHHLLLARGLSVRRTVVTLYALSAAFGGLALLVGTTGYKLLAFLLLAAMMGGILSWLATTPKTAK